MAYQFTASTVPQNLVDAHNRTHRSAVALESAASHYDGPEVNPAGQVQKLTTFYPSAISTLDDAVNVVEKAIALFDGEHALRSNGGDGTKVYAHKVVDTVIGGTVGPSGAVLKQAIVDALAPLAIAHMTALRGHMLNTGGTWHAAPDNFNVIPVPTAITTAQQLFEAVLLIRSVQNDHIVYDAGGIHDAPDTENPISAAPPDSAEDLDAMLAVLIEARTDFIAHAADTDWHANAQTITLTVPAFPAAVSTAFTRINAYKTKHEAHRQSTTHHQASDSSSALTASDATTIATYVALAEEIRTDQALHFEAAPTTRAMRNL